MIKVSLRKCKLASHLKTVETMKTLSVISFPFFLSLFLNAQESRLTVKVSQTIQDELRPGVSCQITGYIGEKLEQSYRNRILAQDENRLVAPFRERTETSCWQSEFWGKWITSAILAYRYHPTPELKNKLDNAVAGLVATQSPDGYLGNYTTDNRLEAWDIWGRKYCMLGLLAYYDLTMDRKALEAAGKVAYNLMDELKKNNLQIVKAGNHRGMAASSVLEPVCLLFSRTGDKKYLEFAEEIVREWETQEGPQLISKSAVDVSARFPRPESNWYGWEQGQKAYEMMSCYEGLLELYRLTGKSEYKQAVERTWQNILDNEINVAGSGASMECWFGGKNLQVFPIKHYQETCVTATWIKLSQQLLRLTGESKYAEAVEQSYLNALLGAMHPDGSDWDKYTPLSGQRMPGTAQCNMGLNCCVASGPRGLYTFPSTVVMSRKEGLQVNFFAKGNYIAETPGKQLVQIVQNTTYPVDGSVGLKLELSKPEEMTIWIRIPAWSEQTLLQVNGSFVEHVAPGGLASIHRKWKTGDSLSLLLDMRGRVIKMHGPPEHFAILRGPIVLSRDSRLPGLPVDANIIPVTDQQGFVELLPVVQKPVVSWMQLKAMFIPESYAEEGSLPVALYWCDYASAGKTYDGNSRFRTWFPLLLDPSKMSEE
jgi:uncharacterized protein